MLNMRWVTLQFARALGSGRDFPIIDHPEDTLPALAEVLDGKSNNASLRTMYARRLETYASRVKGYAAANDIPYEVPSLQRAIKPSTREKILVNALGYLVAALYILCRERPGRKVGEDSTKIVHITFPLNEKVLFVEH